jgi:hypothetical protein
MIIFLGFALWVYACDSKTTEPTVPKDQQPAAAGDRPADDSTAGGGRLAVEEGQTGEPKNVRDFFMLLPEKYFVLEGCDREVETDCQKARVEYLKTFGEVVDIPNGYIKGGCDGGQSCIEMAIFKRPDDKYLVGVAVIKTMGYDYYFLDPKDGNWSDVSSSVVPQFSKANMYELPRHGTTVAVFAKKVIERGDDWEAVEKGQKLYDLEWKDGRFTRRQ